MLPLFIPLFIFVCTRIFFLSFSHSFRLARFHAINILLGFFRIILFCLVPFFVCVFSSAFVHFHCDVDGSRSNLSSSSCSFPLPSHTTFVSIVYLRLAISVSIIVFVLNL